MRNLFIQLHECRAKQDQRRFGSGWEDLLTEQLAFYLACDSTAATSLARTLTRDEATTVTDITLQPSNEDGTPDLALELADDQTLLLEHKVDADLQPRQLRRYLSHGRVAMVSRRNLSVDPAVLENERYLRPVGREHFTWEDIYRSLPQPGDPPAGHEELRKAFRSYLRELGLAPSDLSQKWRRLFDDRTKTENRRVQRQFGRLLNGVATEIRSRYGLTVQDVSHKGKQAYAPDGTRWLHLYVHPVRLRSEIVPSTLRPIFEPGYESLAVEVVFDGSATTEARALLDRLPADSETPAGRTWHLIGMSPIGRNRHRVTVATPLAPFFDDASQVGKEVTTSAAKAVEVVMNQL